MKTLKNIIVGIVLAVLTVLMMTFAVLTMILNYIVGGLTLVTYKLVDDALYIVDKHLLGEKDDDPYIKLLK